MKIEVKQTSIHIYDYELGDCQPLERLLTLWDDITHSYYLYGCEYNPQSKEFIIPKGIDIPYLERAFNEVAYINYESDPTVQLERPMLKFMPRDDDQKKTISFMIGGDNYYSNKRKSQFQINLPTGVGKSYCAIFSACYFALPTIVITSRVKWLHQWIKYVLEYTNLTMDNIGYIDGIAKMNYYVNNGGKFFYFVTHATIRNYCERFGWKALGEAFKALKIGIKIIDEYHYDFDNIVKIDAYTNTHKTYYLSATPSLSDRNKNGVFGLYFKNTTSISISQDKHVKVVALFYKTNPSPKEYYLCTKSKYKFDKNVYNDYILSKSEFFDLLVYIFNICLRKRKSIIYFTKIDTINSVYLFLKNTFPLLIDRVGIFNSSVPDKEKQDVLLNKQIILSTVKSLGTAQDIKDLDFIVNIADPFSSKVLAAQTVGRLRNSNTSYMYIIDTSFTALQSYYKSAKTTFRSIATEVQEVDCTRDGKQLADNAIRIIESLTPRNIYTPISMG